MPKPKAFKIICTYRHPGQARTKMVYCNETGAFLSAPQEIDNDEYIKHIHLLQQQANAAHRPRHKAVMQKISPKPDITVDSEIDTKIQSLEELSLDPDNTTYPTVFEHNIFDEYDEAPPFQNINDLF